MTQSSVVGRFQHSGLDSQFSKVTERLLLPSKAGEGRSGGGGKEADENKKQESSTGAVKASVFWLASVLFFLQGNIQEVFAVPCSGRGTAKIYGRILVDRRQVKLRKEDAEDDDP